MTFMKVIFNTIHFSGIEMKFNVIAEFQFTIYSYWNINKKDSEY